MLDAVVIGSGPAGYIAGIRLAQLGASVIVLEKGDIGGECLNWGCIPSKAMIEVANAYHRINWLRSLGLEIGEARMDLRRVQSWKRGVVKQLTQGIEYLLRFYGAQIKRGYARIAGEGKIELVNGGSVEVLETRNVLIATGAEPVELDQAPFDGRRIIGFKEILELEEVPSSILVVGGGAIGLEMGTAYRKLGSDIAVVEIMDRVLPGIDKDLARTVEKKLKELGVKLYLSSSVMSTSVTPDGVESTIRTPEGDIRLKTEYVLVSVGKRASVIPGIEGVGIKRDKRGFIMVNEHMQTSNTNFYAAGDVTGPPFLAHRSYRQGLVAAECMMGMESVYNPKAMPIAVFTDPEVASVGMTEEEARQQGYEVLVSRFPFQAFGRALTMGEREGLVKIVSDRSTGRVLGVHIAGPHASELIAEASLMLENDSTLLEASRAIHPHPTFSESIIETIEDALGRPLHRGRRLHRAQSS